MSMGLAPVATAPRTGRAALEWAGAAALTILLAILAAHVAGLVLDFRFALRYPYELEYGEGVVWNQATRIPGPTMYSSGSGLPFIVFNYPPVFYLAARVLAAVTPDMLSAGRLVSILSTVAVGPLVAALVLTAGRPYGQRLMMRHVAIGLAAGMLATSLHALRMWGLVMRVDMIAIMLGLAGVLLAARANGRILGTTLGLLLCVAAVYAKQTQLPAGLAVFTVVLLRRPRKALIAGGIALAAALVALLGMELATGGGFLQNILGYNVNRFSLTYFARSLWGERTSFPFMVLMVLAAAWVLLGLWKQRAPGPRLRAVGQLILIVRLIDPTMAARAMIVLHFGLATLMLATMLKSGGNYNYLIDFLCVGSVLIGILLCDLLSNLRPFLLVTVMLAVGVAALPLRHMPDRLPLADLDRQAILVSRIRTAEKPVASEELTLMMRAGKPILFEPSIVTELAALGRWDERPLLRMIEHDELAFMITTEDTRGGTDRRSAAVDAAMRAHYPRVEKVGPELWFNLPD